MQLTRLATIAALCPLTAGCLVSVDRREPGVDFGAEVLSQFNHRGMVQNDEGVAQGTVRVSLPTRWDAGTLWLQTMANMDMANDTGDDAWFPDGHAGEFSEVDTEVGYQYAFDNGWSVAAGTISYTLMHGLEFVTDSPALSERGETKEIFLAGSGPAGPVRTFIEGHWDYDEVRGFYGRLGIGSRNYKLAEKLNLNGRVAVGYSDESHATWTYGPAPGFRSAFLDMLGEVNLSYAIDGNTSVQLTLAGSSILDEEQEAWFKAIGVESENVWVGIGLHWSY